MTPPRPLWKSVQDYVLIAIGMISYAIGWNVFLLPTNVTASGLPGISSIIYWATGCPVQIPYFIVNACNFGAIKFVNDFENAVFDRNKLVMHLDKEVYKGGSLPNLIEGGAPLEIGKFNTKTK